jgi:carboxypeptidase Taq
MPGTSLKDGCLQDVHWFSGPFGGSFQGYTIGNILSAQLYDAAKKDLPEMEDDFSRGNFRSLRLWLNNKLHRWGAILSPDELIQQATAENLSARAYMQYLTAKYSKIYELI